MQRFILKRGSGRRQEVRMRIPFQAEFINGTHHVLKNLELLTEEEKESSFEDNTVMVQGGK